MKYFEKISEKKEESVSLKDIGGQLTDSFYRKRNLKERLLTGDEKDRKSAKAWRKGMLFGGGGAATGMKSWAEAGKKYDKKHKKENKKLARKTYNSWEEVPKDQRHLPVHRNLKPVDPKKVKKFKGQIATRYREKGVSALMPTLGGSKEYNIARDSIMGALAPTQKKRKQLNKKIWKEVK